MESVPVTAPFDEIPAKFAHYLTSVDTQRLDHEVQKRSFEAECLNIWNRIQIFQQ